MMISPFQNEALMDFNTNENCASMLEALKLVDSTKGIHCPLVIGGEHITTQNLLTSKNPSNFKEIIGTSSCADTALAEKAINVATEAFFEWRKVSVDEKASCLFKAAAILRRRKMEFSAWLVEEAGKNWNEADADTAEAIDFLEYYGRQALRLRQGMETAVYPGEINECYYTPLGVGVIISPWNFPLAILAGMTAAAVVTGNTVIMKPASSTVVVASKFMEVWEEARLPWGVINYLPGSGSVIGDYLVQHPKVRFINFTGSKEVGLRINALAAQSMPTQKWIKRVYLEMGGKNAIIVDAEASLQTAAEGIVASAFGYQGQKCSACSRAIIVSDVYDTMVERIADLTSKISVGPSRRKGINMGPVIDEKAYGSILHYIETGKKEGRLVCGQDILMEGGYYIPPTVFADVRPEAKIAIEEIFGPVLSIIRADNFDHALRIANDTEYGLTGAVYSRHRARLAQARADFHVGNLYLNRKCTGALVGVQPFGGFNMSGTDSKAGGTDYLLLFMQAKSITEKL